MPSSPSRPFFLPVDIAVAHAFLRAGDVPTTPVERAGLLGALLQIASPLPHMALERLIHDASAQFLADPDAGRAYLQSLRGAAATLDPQEIHAALARTGVTYIPSSTVLHAGMRGADGTYAYGFQDACREQMDDWTLQFETSAGDTEAEGSADEEQPTTRTHIRFRGMRDQGVVAQVIATSRDEHIAVDGYAGTGKSHLIHTIAASLGNGVTYIAPSQAHLFGFSTHAAGSGSQVRRTTLWELAHHLSRLHSRAMKLGYALQSGTSMLSADQQASIAGIDAIGDAGRLVVLQRARAIISTWCHSSASAVSERHVRRHVRVDLVEVPRYIDAAQRLWKAMVGTAPKGGHAFTLNIHHLAKWLTVTGAVIPRSFGLLLVDEAHDLTGAWRHLFARYAGGCVLLGDPNQRLTGNPLQEAGAKSVTMWQSVRMGLGAEALVQRALDMDPTAPITTGFAASLDHITRQRHYQRADAVPSGGLHLHGSAWTLLEAALRLRDAGAAYRLLPTTTAHLERLLRDTLPMRSGHEAFRSGRSTTYRSWSAVVAELEHLGLHSLLARFDRGFSMQEVQQMKDGQAADEVAATTLGLIEHARNIESDVTVLMDCCFDVQLGQRNYMPSRAAYLALTRARHEIWLPGDAMDRLQILQATAATAATR